MNHANHIRPGARGAPQFEAEVAAAATMRERAVLFYMNGPNALGGHRSLHVDDMEHFASRELETLTEKAAQLRARLEQAEGLLWGIRDHSSDAQVAAFADEFLKVDPEPPYVLTYKTAAHENRTDRFPTVATAWAAYSKLTSDEKYHATIDFDAGAAQ